MALNAKQKEILVHLAHRLIGGMEAIDEAAKAALAKRRHSDGSLTMARVTNTLVHGGPSEVQSVAAISGGQAAELRQLSDEPFIARVVAKNEDGDVKTFYFARSMPLTKAQLDSLDGPLASYRGVKGRLAEMAPGQEVSLDGFSTDFSPVQLACMQELARPEFRSFFVCGDFRQRITPWGLRSVDELRWVASDFELKEITIGYRQSKRLAAFAGALSRLNGDIDANLQTTPHVEDGDIPPLLGEDLRGDGLARWLRDRVRQVERALGQVPSIAIFVDGDPQIDRLVRVLRPLLVEHNLDVVGCKEGKVKGTDGQVRVFDVQHIKGLEFEAVFFVGVDALAQRLPDLFDKYLYVGSTRAATYLGLTCEGTLPALLEPLRSHFSTDDW